MRTFICDSCNGTLYFENDMCLRFATVHPADGSGYCIACGLNDVVPDLADQRRRALWGETERAKRRLIFSLLQLRLPLLRLGAKRALRFRLLADERVDTGAVDPPKQEPIHMGHDNGCLTVDVGEADDAHREAIRKRMREPYRTMLGHLRHEIGHYYWYVLVDGTPLLPTFRGLFGDEQKDYESALKSHYESGPPNAWQQWFVSAYASFEDCDRRPRDRFAVAPRRREWLREYSRCVAATQRLSEPAEPKHGNARRLSVRRG